MGPLIASLNAAVDLDTFWKTSLQLLHHSLPHHSCSLLYGIVDSQTLRARHHLPGTRAHWRSLSNLSIAQTFLARHPQIYTFSQVLSEDPSAHERRLAQQSSLLDPWDEFVHLAFWDGDRVDAVLSVRRGPAHGSFQLEEMSLLQSLHPVIDTALHRLRLLGRERSRQTSIERFLADVPLPVLFLDSELRLICSSHEGFASCADWNFGQDVARRLNLRRSFRLPQAILDACHELNRRPQNPDGTEEARVPHPTNRNLVARIAIDKPRSSPWSTPVFRVIFLVDRNLDGVPLLDKPASVALLQRLTANERRVALLVGEGCSNRTIAARLGKSPRTVECQLTGIFKKLGVSNRVQLARVMT
jgi:DNA-binding CsgD family transcriptional regulator